MTLRDTELIGKKLVKHGFYRSSTDHQNYKSPKSSCGITVHFKPYGSVWVALIAHDIDSHTIVKFNGHSAVFTPQWLREEHQKLQAAFKFLRS
jgi:hypothetical protein